MCYKCIMKNEEIERPESLIDSVEQLLEKLGGYKEVIKYVELISDDDEEINEAKYYLGQLNDMRYYDQAKELLEYEEYIERIEINLWETYAYYDDHEDELREYAEEEGINIESEGDLERFKEEYVNRELEAFWHEFKSAIKKAKEETGIPLCYEWTHDRCGLCVVMNDYGNTGLTYYLEFWDYSTVDEILDEYEYYCDEIGDYDYFRAVREVDEIIEKRYGKIAKFIEILKQELMECGYGYVLRGC